MMIDECEIVVAFLTFVFLKERKVKGETMYVKNYVFVQGNNISMIRYYTIRYLLKFYDSINNSI
jgi:hypothetical protein